MDWNSILVFCCSKWWPHSSHNERRGGRGERGETQGRHRRSSIFPCHRHSNHGSSDTGSDPTVVQMTLTSHTLKQSRPLHLKHFISVGCKILSSLLWTQIFPTNNFGFDKFNIVTSFPWKACKDLNTPLTYSTSFKC
jgi:hypothetical protein